MLYRITIPNFRNSAGRRLDIEMTYQLFGRPLQEAPIVLINHSLTGNSNVAGEQGWWNPVVGAGKPIDTEKFSVIAFDMPGNGYGGPAVEVWEHYEEFTLKDLAKLQYEALKRLFINELFAIVGGSIGGALAWELAILKPDITQHLIPIATDYKTTDWVLAQCKVQDQILRNSASPVADARMHAMTFYRNPTSFSQKFSRARNPQDGDFEVQRWLTHHGRQLEHRFECAAYKLMNHLLTTVDITGGKGDYAIVASKIQSEIHFVTINSDWFFLADENWDAYVDLSLLKKEVSIHEIKSLHGHDAFLIEYRQLNRILKPIFKHKQNSYENHQYHTLRSGEGWKHLDPANT